MASIPPRSGAQDGQSACSQFRQQRALAGSLQDALPKIVDPANKPTKVVSDFENPPKSANTMHFTLLNKNSACDLTL
jgi:hypothetical protein